MDLWIKGSEQIVTYFRHKYFSFAFFGSTTADPASSQAIDIHKWSSLAEGQQEFHLHTTGFEYGTFFPVPGYQKGL